MSFPLCSTTAHAMPVPGYAMAVQNNEKTTGAIIGKAMTPLEEGQDLVLAVVSLQ